MLRPRSGHLGGKVLIPLADAVRNLNAARLASDVAGTDTLVVARTDAESAQLLSSDYDSADYKWMSGDRTADGFWKIEGGLEMGCERGAAYAEYADLVWCETSTPCLKDARRFADAVKGSCPDAMLAYNCSPSFNWRQSIPGDAELQDFQHELGKMGFKFQFITLAGFHIQTMVSSTLHVNTRIEVCLLMHNYKKPSSEQSSLGTQVQNTNEKSVWDILMKLPRRWGVLPKRSKIQPKQRNSNICIWDLENEG